MKTKSFLFALLGILTFSNLSAQLQFGQKESFAFSAYSVKTISSENILHFGADIEYRGAIYAKAGFEVGDDALTPYFDVHGGAGLRLTLGWEENIILTAGGRAAFTSRNGNPNPVGGAEAGFEYVFNGGFLVGVNASRLYHADYKAAALPEVWENHFAFKIGYTWNWKN